MPNMTGSLRAAGLDVAQFCSPTTAAEVLSQCSCADASGIRARIDGSRSENSENQLPKERLLLSIRVPSFAVVLFPLAVGLFAGVLS